MTYLDPKDYTMRREGNKVLLCAIHGVEIGNLTGTLLIVNLSYTLKATRYADSPLVIAIAV